MLNKIYKKKLTTKFKLNLGVEVKSLRVFKFSRFFSSQNLFPYVGGLACLTVCYYEKKKGVTRPFKKG